MAKVKAFLICAVMLMLSMGLSAQAPQWLWAKSAGGASDDNGRAISQDGGGNSYITGSFVGTATFGTITLTSATEFSWDIFVAKMDPLGNWLWAIRAGGDSKDEGCAIATDDLGNSYVTGYFANTVSFGSTALTSLGYYELFVAKLDSNGNWLWAKRGGGTDDDGGYGIAIDSSGNSYVTGCFRESGDFGTSTLASHGYQDIVIAKLDTSGNWLWAKRAGSAAWYDCGYAVSYDSSGIYVTGAFARIADFGSTTLTNHGNNNYIDMFAAKLDLDGNWLWAKRAGSEGLDVGWSVSADGLGNCLVCGGFSEIADFGGTALSSLGGYDMFVAKLDSAGDWLWIQPVGGIDDDIAYGIRTDSDQNSYVSGGFSTSVNFGTTSLSSSGAKDTFAAKISPAGDWLWAIRGGGTSEDYALAICTDSTRKSFITGCYMGSVSFGSTNLTNGSTEVPDIFVAKLSAGGVPVDDGLTPGLGGMTHLYDAYPNPLRRGETAAIKADIAERETAVITIFNIRGQSVASYLLKPGFNQISMESKDLPCGVYLYQLKTQNTSISKKLVIIRCNRSSIE